MVRATGSLGTFGPVLLAELEIWHSRPIAPTRRVALGHLVLPVEPPPGFGGILLGGVVAAHIAEVDPELLGDLHRLINEVDRGLRIVQPRLRHRYQVDRVGLARSRHRLVADGESLRFEFEEKASPLQQILGAVYATERLGPHVRHSVAAVLHKAMRWQGPLGPAFVAHLSGLSGARSYSAAAFADPRAWALGVLGLSPGERPPDRREIMARFRQRLREVHPDHGGAVAEASRQIGDLTEARRILLG